MFAAAADKTFDSTPRAPPARAVRAARPSYTVCDRVRSLRILSRVSTGFVTEGLRRGRVLWVRLEGPHDVIPKHDVLTVVCVGNGMVRIVRADSEDRHGGEGQVQRRDVEPRVIERSECAADNKEQHARYSMHGHNEARRQVDGEDMVVFTKDELDGVHVDRVSVAPRGHNLPVVMLVYEAVHRAVVECPVKRRVEEVVHDEKNRQRDARVRK